jgi:hypothetical protein
MLCRIEDGYQDNPYHNSTHAAHVLHGLDRLLMSGLTPHYADNTTTLAAMLSAVSNLRCSK